MQEPDAAQLIVDHMPALHRSLRVAVVTETYPPEVNGVALTMARIVEGLQQRNHDIQLVRPRQSGDGQALVGDAGVEQVLTRGMPIPRYPNLRMGMPSRRYLKQMWAHQRPDVVHIATEGPLGWSALQAALQLQLPVSSDFRTNFHAYSRHYGIGWLHKPIMAYLRKFHNRAHCTMVPTEALRGELDRLGFRGLRVVSRGVDLARFDPAQRSADLRASWGVGVDDPVLACVGRLAPEKNLDTLLQAYQAFKARRPRARLLLVGDGPLRAQLQQCCPEAIFAGQQSGQSLAAHYASADLFLFPSLTETFGNVTIEAMASGLPVLAFGYAAAAELINDGEQGRLVPMGNNNAFIHAASALADEDAAHWRRAGLMARQRALSRDWNQVVLQFESALSDVIRHAVPGIASLTLSSR